ncbi:MAG: hypothetical protein O2779_01325 [Nanoarchaeota archaeon]|nr:hypothetical protein [Nanoarchaeota archaeon]
MSDGKAMCENCGYRGAFSHLGGNKGHWCNSYGCIECKKVVTYCDEEWTRVSKFGECLTCKSHLINYPTILKSFNLIKEKLMCPGCEKQSLKLIMPRA